jgi:anti-sigma B factor antagonist
MGKMNIEIQKQEDVVIVKLGGELERQTVSGVQEKLVPLIGPDCKIVMDMHEVSYISSAGLRMFLLFYRQVDGGNGRIVLTGLQEMIYDTMSITGFLDFFQTYTTVAEGINALQQPLT